METKIALEKVTLKLSLLFLLINYNRSLSASDSCGYFDHDLLSSHAVVVAPDYDFTMAYPIIDNKCNHIPSDNYLISDLIYEVRLSQHDLAVLDFFFYIYAHSVPSIESSKKENDMDYLNIACDACSYCDLHSHDSYQEIKYSQATQ